MKKSIINSLLILAMTTGGIFALIAKADRVVIEDRWVTTSTGARKPGVVIYND